MGGGRGGGSLVANRDQISKATWCRRCYREAPMQNKVSGVRVCEDAIVFMLLIITVRQKEKGEIVFRKFLTKSQNQSAYGDQAKRNSVPSLLPRSLDAEEGQRCGVAFVKTLCFIMCLCNRFDVSDRCCSKGVGDVSCKLQTYLIS